MPISTAVSTLPVVELLLSPLAKPGCSHVLKDSECFPSSAAAHTHFAHSGCSCSSSCCLAAAPDSPPASAPASAPAALQSGCLILHPMDDPDLFHVSWHL